MTHTGKRRASVLGTGIRYVLTVLAGMTISMVIAYAAVRVLTNNTSYAPDADAASVDRGWALRANANELTRLMNAFTEAIPTPAIVVTPSVKSWLHGDMAHDIEALQHALSEDRMLNLPAARDLLNACGRLLAMTLHPDDAGLRGAVTAEVHHALEDVDNYLRDAGLQRRIALPVTPLR